MALISAGLGRSINRQSVSFDTISGEAASTTHAAQEIAEAAMCNLQINVTAVGTTASMLITFDGSNDGTNYYQLCVVGANGTNTALATAPAQITTAGTYYAIVPGAQWMRSRSTISGAGASFTYTIGGSYT